MQAFLKWLDRAPLFLLIALAVWMAGAPFTPEPHLVEKLRLLFQGTLTRPLDIFDLLMHAAPSVLLAVKLARRRKKKLMA